MGCGIRRYLSCNSRSSSISSSVSEYYYLLNGNNPINHEISMLPYPNQENAAYNPVLPSTTKVLTTEFGVPLKSSFVSTSSYSLGGSSVGVGSIKNFVSHSVVRLVERRQFNTLNDDYSLGDMISPGLLYNGIFQVQLIIVVLHTMTKLQVLWFLLIIN